MDDRKLTSWFESQQSNRSVLVREREREREREKDNGKKDDHSNNNFTNACPHSQLGIFVLFNSC